MRFLDGKWNGGVHTKALSIYTYAVWSVLLRPVTRQYPGLRPLLVLTGLPEYRIVRSQRKPAFQRGRFEFIKLSSGPCAAETESSSGFSTALWSGRQHGAVEALRAAGGGRRDDLPVAPTGDGVNPAGHAQVIAILQVVTGVRLAMEKQAW
jgi:hypothetical protein